MGDVASEQKTHGYSFSDVYTDEQVSQEDHVMEHKQKMEGADGDSVKDLIGYGCAFGA